MKKAKTDEDDYESDFIDDEEDDLDDISNDEESVDEWTPDDDEQVISKKYDYISNYFFFNFTKCIY